MATHPLSLPFADPAHVAADALASRLATDTGVTRRDLLAEMTHAYGSTSADGRWSQRAAYDVLEAAQVLHLTSNHIPTRPIERLRYLIDMTQSLPTQSARSESQVTLQQFSTPAPIGFLAAQAIGVRPTDIVLEPSAGTGLLAVHAAHVGAGLILNEIDPWRSALLAHSLPSAGLTCHDGEILDDLLDPAAVATRVLINPPFSRSLGRGVDRHAGLRHLRAAFRRLAPGGRCAVTPSASRRAS